MHIKIFGIQRTGTNYLEFLIRSNVLLADSPVILNDVPFTRDHFPGWKHEAVPVVDVDEQQRRLANNIAVILIKNPYTWYKSIRRWTRGTEKFSFDGFGGRDPEHFFKQYNSLYADHKKLLIGEKRDTVYEHSALIRYEDLILNPRKEIYKFAVKFNLTIEGKFSDTNRAVQSRVFTESMRTYYLAQKPDYSADIVERVNEAVDWELMRFYGYEKI